MRILATALALAALLAPTSFAAAQQTPAPATPATPAPAAPAAPAPAATPPANPLSWSTRCVSEGRRLQQDCSMEQRAYVTSSGQFIGSVTIRIPPDTQEPVMMIHTPLGLFIESGVTFDVDGASPQTLPLQTCDNNGCYAGSPVSATLLTSMSRGTILNVSFENLSRQKIGLPMSLIGFTAAFQKIQ